MTWKESIWGGDAGGSTEASNISISDAGGYFDSLNVEDALQEIGAGGGGSNASSITTDVSNFNALLSAADINVQIALETLDDHKHDDRYYTETEINTWRNGVTQEEMGYLHGVTSDIQTQLDNKLSALTFGIADGNAVDIDDSDVEAADYAKFTANGLEGRSYAEMKSDLALNNVSNVAIDDTAYDETTWNSNLDGATKNAIRDKFVLNESEIITWRNGVTQAEMGYLHGVTSDIQTQLDNKQATLTFGISDGNAVDIDGIDVEAADYARFTANGLEGRSYAEMKADLALNNVSNVAINDTAYDPTSWDSNLDGATKNAIRDKFESDSAAETTWRNGVTQAEMGYLHGVTSDIQTQLDGKLTALLFGIADGNAVDIDDSDVESGDYARFTANGLEGRSYAEMKSDLALNNVSNVAIDDTIYDSTSWNSNLDGATKNAIRDKFEADSAAETTWRNGVTQTEMGYLHGVTSDIQTQLDGKQATLTFGIVNGNAVDIDASGIEAADYAKFTANGLEGRSYAEMKSDLALNNVSNVAIDDTAYDATSWNSNLDGATKNAIRDKFEADSAAETTWRNGVTQTEMGYVHGVSSDIQTQLNSKQATLTFGIADGNAVDIDASGVVSGDYAKFTANGLEGRSYAEVKADLSIEGMSIDDTPYDPTSWNSNLDGATKNAIRDKFEADSAAETTWRNGVTQTEMGYVHGVTSDIQTQLDNKLSALTFGIAYGNAVDIDDSDVESGDYARFTANGLEGRSYAEMKSDLALNNVSNVAIDDTAYDATSWDSNLDGATKNAIRDKFESDSAAETTWRNGVTQTEMGYLHGVTSDIQTQLDGKLSALTFGIADGNAVDIDDSDVEAADYAKFTANGLEGRSYAEMKSDLALNNVSNVAIDDTAYDATSWDSNLDGATKNAIRDKFESDSAAETTWRNGVTQTEMGYVHGVTSDIQTQLDGKLSELTFGIAYGNAVDIDDSDVESADYAKFTANGLEGRSYAEVKSDLALNNVSNVSIDNTAYDSTSWNSNIDGATKNAIRNKFVLNDAAIALNTAKRTYPEADETKVSNISITQAVDLDTIESDTSLNNTHRGVTTGNPHNVLATQITDFDTEVSNNASVTANSAKVTNANHTGDVTGSTTLTIANNIVSYAKMQDVSATDRILGRSTAGSGDIEEIVCTAAGRALLDDTDASAQRTTLGLSNVQNTKNNLTATTDPVAGDDSGDGYSVGSIWINLTLDRAFICVDSTAGSAVWKWLDQSGGSTPSNLTATTDPGSGDDSVDGYVVSSIWVNLTLDRAFICVDNTAGSAVWNLIGQNIVGKGYTLGGYTGSVTSAIEALDFSNETMTTLSATLNTAKRDLTGLSSTTKGYVLGGDTGSQTAVIEDLIFSNETSQAISATLDTAKRDATGVSSTTKGYAMGGYDSDETTDIEELVFSSETSQTITATLDTAVTSGSPAMSTTKGYMLGGFDTDETDEIQDLIFSNETSQTISATLNAIKRDGAGVSSSIKGYILGGYTSYSDPYVAVRNSLRFSDETVQTLGSELSHPVRDGAGVDNLIKGYVIGGYDGGYSAKSENLVFSSETSQVIGATLDSGKRDLAGLSS